MRSWPAVCRGDLLTYAFNRLGRSANLPTFTVGTLVIAAII